MKTILLKSLVLVFVSFFIIIFSYFYFIIPSLAACPPDQSCPDRDYCVSSCDAFYDDVDCICIVCPSQPEYGGTCTQGGCGKCGGGCFTETTEIIAEQETEKIKNLEVGDKVSSFNPETGEISESQVTEAYQLSREGYFELETESGKKVKVTGEHPFLAVEGEKTFITEVKEVLFQTLTYQLITSLQTRVVEILK